MSWFSTRQERWSIQDSAVSRISKEPSRRPSAAEGWLLLLAAGCLAMAFAFAKFGSEVHEGELAMFDRVVRDWLIARRSETGTRVFQGITQLGAKEVLAPLSLLI